MILKPLLKNSFYSTADMLSAGQEVDPANAIASGDNHHVHTHSILLFAGSPIRLYLELIVIGEVNCGEWYFPRTGGDIVILG